MSRRIHSEMTATISQVLVTVGDEVNEMDTVVVLESMKMEIPVRVPSAGRVEEVAVAVGDQVPEGELLVVIAE